MQERVQVQRIIPQFNSGDDLNRSNAAKTKKVHSKPQRSKARQD